MLKSTIQDRLKTVHERIDAVCKRVGRKSDSVRLVVVTKTYPSEAVQEVLLAGEVHIGENRVQEIESKAPLLQGDYSLHLIGHLQSNKVAKVVPFVDWIESVDSVRLLKKIENQCDRHGKKMNVLVQVNTSNESSKSGCLPEDAFDICESAFNSPFLNFKGLMTIGPLGGNEMQVRKSFEMLRGIKEKCESLVTGQFELSMGMSGDFEWAIEEGSTNIRVGSLIMGNRTYQ